MKTKQKTKDSFGRYVWKLRQQKGGKGNWSLRAVAERAGMSPSYLSDIENDKGDKPSINVVKKLADVYNYSHNLLMEVAGYIDKEEENSKHYVSETLKIPVKEIIMPDLVFAQEAVDTVEINYEMVQDYNALAVKCPDDSMSSSGIFEGDIVIISPKAEIKNGDMIACRVDGKLRARKYYEEGESLILSPCNTYAEPIILPLNSNRLHLLGKIVCSIRKFQ